MRVIIVWYDFFYYENVPLRQFVRVLVCLHRIIDVPRSMRVTVRILFMRICRNQMRNPNPGETFVGDDLSSPTGDTKLNSPGEG